jgi:hypothetical protein
VLAREREAWEAERERRWRRSVEAATAVAAPGPATPAAVADVAPDETAAAEGEVVVEPEEALCGGRRRTTLDRDRALLDL